jgi:diguanylate cyclase
MMIIAFLVITGQMLREKGYSLKEESLNKMKLITGIKFGVLGIILMIYAINIKDVVIIDLRNISTILSVLYGGTLSVLITEIIIS